MIFLRNDVQNTQQYLARGHKPRSSSFRVEAKANQGKTVQSREISDKKRNNINVRRTVVRIRYRAHVARLETRNRRNTKEKEDTKTRNKQKMYRILSARSGTSWSTVGRCDVMIVTGLRLGLLAVGELRARKKRKTKRNDLREKNRRKEQQRPV